LTASGHVYVSPEAHRVVVGRSGVPLATLEGVTLGLLCNSKPNAQLLLDAVAEGLGERVRLAGIVRDSKAAPTSAAPPEVYANLAARCGAVIFASAT
jgi:hypothetical protein